jgi:hypothetical protein
MTSVAKEHRWMVEMEIQTHLGQRALYKIPMWSLNEKTAKHQGAKHANEMQSGVVKVCNLQVYRLTDDQILLPGLYPLEQRHHLGVDPVAPFDSVQDLPSFERALNQDFLRGGKYASRDYFGPGLNSRPPQGYLYAEGPEEDDEETTQLLFDSIESESKILKKPRPLWKRLLCCVCSSSSESESSKSETSYEPTRVRARADSW